MCSGSTTKPSPASGIMGDETQKQDGYSVGKSFSLLLEFSATNDISSFMHAVEKEGCDMDESGYWYGRKIGSTKKMGFEERTPLMIAAMFGSKHVLSYILQKGCLDVNRACGSDGATALHCAAAGGCVSSVEIVKLLIDASADISCVDVDGKRPVDVISPCLGSSSKSRTKALEALLRGHDDCFEEPSCLTTDQEVAYGGEDKKQQLQPEVLIPVAASSEGNGIEKKEYPLDPSLPDIKNGIYGTDEFRMFTFKVKPCSRAYSHDWTECPFVHPGENARRRDPRKYHYSCVPCPEFRKGSCLKGDACEYAHGIFECWLHPAQYRTRLCKDETNCSRRVCFFAHKIEELRPLYASTGSAVPSPRSYSSTAASLDMGGSLSPLALGSPSMLMSSTSTPPMTPTGASSPLWQNQLNGTPPPALQLPGSRLKAALHARDMGMETELLELQNQRRHQQLLEEMADLSPNTSWNNQSYGGSGELGRFGGLKPNNLDDAFGSSMDPAISSQFQGLSMQDAAAMATQLHSPKAMHLRHRMNQQQLRSSYSSSGLACSPVRSSGFVAEHQPGSPSAAAVMNSRSAAFAKRSQSFVDRGAANRFSPVASANMMVPCHLSGWGSPTGKLDWAVQGDELNKLRKSASFGIRSNGKVHPTSPTSVPAAVEPGVSWVQSLVKDAPAAKSAAGQLSLEDQQLQKQHLINSGGSDVFPPWVELLYMEQEQMVA